MSKQQLEVSAFEINKLNEVLERGLKVLSDVDGSDDYEHSYPYGTGYGKSALWETLQTVRTWKEELK